MFDPDQLLQKLEAAQAAEAGGGLTAATVPQSCGFCWAALPVQAQVCPDCGHSVAESEAARQAALAADRQWRPPAREVRDPAISSRVPPPVTPVTPEAERPWQSPAWEARYEEEPVGDLAAPESEDLPPVAPPATPRRRRRANAPAPRRAPRLHSPVTLGVVLGGTWGVAAAAIAWFTIVAPYQFGERGTVADLQTAPVTGGRQSGEAIPGKAGSEAAGVVVPIVWGQLYPELRVRLYDAAGELVADSEERRQSPELSVPAGTYYLEFTDFTGQWPKYRERLVVSPGAAVQLTISNTLAGTYYLWLAEYLEQRDRRPQALRAWEMAVRLAPESVPARLGLAAALLHAERPEAAAEWIDAVLSQDPENADALTLRSQLPDRQTEPVQGAERSAGVGWR